MLNILSAPLLSVLLISANPDFLERAGAQARGPSPSASQAAGGDGGVPSPGPLLAVGAGLVLLGMHLARRRRAV